jgi:hypothetical protein
MRRMLLSCHREGSLNTPLKTAIAPHVLILICRHHVKVSEDDLGDEALVVFLQGYAKTSLKDDEYDLTFLGAEIEYQMNLKPFERVENLACQCARLFRRMSYNRLLKPRKGRRSGDK